MTTNAERPASPPTAEERADMRQHAAGMLVSHPHLVLAHDVLRLLDALGDADAALVAEYKARMATEDQLYRAYRDLREAAERARTPATTAPSEETHDISEEYDFSNERALRVGVASSPHRVAAEPSADAASECKRLAQVRSDADYRVGAYAGSIKSAAYGELLAKADGARVALYAAIDALAAERDFWREHWQYACAACAPTVTAADYAALTAHLETARAMDEENRDRVIAVVVAWQSSGRVPYQLRDEVLDAARAGQAPAATEPAT